MRVGGAAREAGSAGAGSGTRHRVEIFGLGGWLAWRLGFDPRGGVPVRDWLALSGAITDPVVGRLPPAGSADQIIDSTPALGDPSYPRAVTTVSDRDVPVSGVSDTQT